ncbi:hypothetical protein PCE1_002579 [Barthelona sp. PCE]
MSSFQDILKHVTGPEYDVSSKSDVKKASTRQISLFLISELPNVSSLPYVLFSELRDEVYAFVNSFVSSRAIPALPTQEFLDLVMLGFNAFKELKDERNRSWETYKAIIGFDIKLFEFRNIFTIRNNIQNIIKQGQYSDDAVQNMFPTYNTTTMVHHHDHWEKAPEFLGNETVPTDIDHLLQPTPAEEAKEAELENTITFSSIREDIRNGLSSSNSTLDFNDVMEAFNGMLDTCIDGNVLSMHLVELLGFDHLELITTISCNMEAIKESRKDAKSNVHETANKNINERMERESGLTAGPTSAENVFFKDNVRNIGMGRNRKRAVVENVRNEHNKFTIPPPQHFGATRPNVSLIPVSTCPSMTRRVFDFERFNTLQSLVFEKAFNTDKNLLVCAPTGAGKTNVAFLTVMRTLQTCVDESGMKFDREKLKNVKMVYLAPMKALVTEIFGKMVKRLRKLGVIVKEVTGDTSISPQELSTAQLLVCTPEKWDILSRRSLDSELLKQLKLVLIDEVHLLASERGAVIEAIIARCLRQVEILQLTVRLVALSATLPNYKDVAEFMRVHDDDIVFLDPRYRPVPLNQIVIGVQHMLTDIEYSDLPPKAPRSKKQYRNELMFEYILKHLEEGQQMIIFVHGRAETVRLCTFFANLIGKARKQHLMHPAETTLNSWGYYRQQVSRKLRDRSLNVLFESGFFCHHAGMHKSDRRLAESLFLGGAVQILISTATLAWGVNLPASVVMINGTTVRRGDRFDDLDVLDIEQMFGRAGRPQFDTEATAYLFTTSDKFQHYYHRMVEALPIESQLCETLNDHLNAEIVRGTITTDQEAISWLNYTFFGVRVLKNPAAYGSSMASLGFDPTQFATKEALVRAACSELKLLQMINYDKFSGNLMSTELGRIAAHYYIPSRNMKLFNSQLSQDPSFADLIYLLASAHEFRSMRIRDDERDEFLAIKERCPYILNDVKGLKVKKSVFRKLLYSNEKDIDYGYEQPMPEDNADIDESIEKAFYMIQAHISQHTPKTPSLVSDIKTVDDSIGRIVQGLLSIAVFRRWYDSFVAIMELVHCVKLRTFPGSTCLLSVDRKCRPNQLITHDFNISPLEMRVMEAADFLEYTYSNSMAATLKALSERLPVFGVEYNLQPITIGVVRLNVKISCDMDWKGTRSVPTWLVVHDCNANLIISAELIQIVRSDEPLDITLMIPLVEQARNHEFTLSLLPESMMGCEFYLDLPVNELVFPHASNAHTELLPCTALKTSVVGNDRFSSIWSFNYFNPIQTQVFHSVFHHDDSLLLGAPTGSGKTVIAELALMRMVRSGDDSKCVYVAPLKALVNERARDWRKKFPYLRIIELTGESQPTPYEIERAHIICASPEKWDGVTRFWQRRRYVQRCSLVIMDEIHLLGTDRGAVLETIVCRMRYMAENLGKHVRFVGLSTALSNCEDVAEWLGVKRNFLFNFHAALRPVKLDVHLQGYSMQHYCPRMRQMNKPVFNALNQHAAGKPSIVFVASRRQTRLTAMDLIAFAVQSNDWLRWSRMDSVEAEMHANRAKDPALRDALVFGVGLHHAGLAKEDKMLVEELFLSQKILVLVSTSTLAWGLNFPAHCVIVKGTVFFDAKQCKFVDLPVTDVLQMIGRAGRPQFNDSGVALILTHTSKKPFWRQFLYEPFPVESALLPALPDFLNGEIATGAVSTVSDATRLIGKTYMAQRMRQNPSFYGLKAVSSQAIRSTIHDAVIRAVGLLKAAKCIDEEEGVLCITPFGTMAAYYYLSFRSIQLFCARIRFTRSLNDTLNMACSAAEFSEMPVRHNEDNLNEELAGHIRFPPKYGFDSPHVKTAMLLQCHFGHVALPISDYATDLFSALGQIVRVFQGVIDLSAEKKDLAVFRNTITLLQMSNQGIWYDSHPLTAFSAVTKHHALLLPNFRECVRLAHVGELRPVLFDAGIDSMGMKIIKKLKCLPYYTCTASYDDECITLIVDRGAPQIKNKKDEVRTLTHKLARSSNVESVFVYVHTLEEFITMKRQSIRSTTTTIAINTNLSSVSGDVFITIAPELYVGLEVSYLLKRKQ